MLHPSVLDIIDLTSSHRSIRWEIDFKLSIPRRIFTIGSGTYDEERQHIQSDEDWRWNEDQAEYNIGT
jgi:hypothetical protein